MRVSQEKSKFFKKSVEYLGFIVSCAGLTTSPDKIKAIEAFQPPTSLYSLRSFMGVCSYYMCFIKSFATIARPLTEILKGVNVKVSANQSRKIKIELSPKQVESFEKFKNL